MAGFFSPDTLERVRAASDIVDVIGSYLPLKRAGGSFVALCPFHKEKTPSFNVNPHKQIFHCFGCHKGGDVFAFVKEYENLDFPEAVRRLADRAKIPLETDSRPGEQQARHLKQTLLELHDQIAQRWHTALVNDAAGQIARDYLVRRGVSKEAVELFRIGYAPEAWDDTVNWARSKGYELPLVEKAGLVIKKAESDRFYDRFRGRLMFPICDEQGRVIGFSGRILVGDEKSAKYVNSPETPIFTKSKVFFGLDKSKRAILDAGFAIICEGQLDLIACFMGGVQNIVAPQGTAFTEEHARILKRYVEEVVLCFDSDEAGQNAAVRSLDHLLASGLAVRVAVVPAPHDPDSFIKEFGAPAFRTLIDQADGFFDYYLKRLCGTQDLTQDKGRLAVLNSMAEAVLKTGNVVIIDKYAQKTALRLGVTPEAVRTEFRKLSRKAAPQASVGEEILQNTEPERPSIPEYWLLKILFRFDELVPWAAEHVKPEWIQHGPARAIVTRRIESQRQGTWTSLPGFLDQLENPTEQTLITEATTEDRDIPNAAQQLQELCTRLRNQFLDRRIAELRYRVDLPETPDPEKIALLREQHLLRTEKLTKLG